MDKWLQRDMMEYLINYLIKLKMDKYFQRDMKQIAQLKVKNGQVISKRYDGISNKLSNKVKNGQVFSKRYDMEYVN